MKAMLRFALAAPLLLAQQQAYAASGIVQITAKDAGGTTRNFNVNSDSGLITGNLQWQNNICDPTTTTQCAAVNASGQVAVVVGAALPAGANQIGTINPAT